MKKYLNIILILIMSTVLGIILIYGMGYSKYVNIIGGIGNTEIAEMICETEVIASNVNTTSINQSYIVRVKNFDSENVITETAVDYIVVVSTTDGEDLPDYYCIDSNGIEIANTVTGNGEIAGSLGCNAQETDEYTIYFINNGSANVVRNISVSTNAVQQR